MFKGILKTALIVIFLILITLYLKLGWFLILILPFGAVLTVLFNRSSVKELESPKKVMAALLLAYVVFSFLFWYPIVVPQSRDIDLPMTWTVIGENETHEQSKVELLFVDYPGHYQNIYSDDLAEYLNSQTEQVLLVKFRISSRLGCDIGHSTVKIGDLDRWQQGYSSTGSRNAKEPGPFAASVGWWCP